MYTHELNDSMRELINNDTKEWNLKINPNIDFSHVFLCTMRNIVPLCQEYKKDIKTILGLYLNGIHVNINYHEYSDNFTRDYQPLVTVVNKWHDYGSVLPLTDSTPELQLVMLKHAEELKIDPFAKNYHNEDILTTLVYNLVQEKKHQDRADGIYQTVLNVALDVFAKKNKIHTSYGFKKLLKRFKKISSGSMLFDWKHAIGMYLEHAHLDKTGFDITTQTDILDELEREWTKIKETPAGLPQLSQPKKVMEPWMRGYDMIFRKSIVKYWKPMQETFATIRQRIKDVTNYPTQVRAVLVDSNIFPRELSCIVLFYTF